MNQRHCKSPFCITADGIKGRIFTPPEEAQGLASIWCPTCVQLGKQVQFFSTQTAQMIRHKYEEYRPAELPQNVSAVLTQFAREIINELGEEL